MNVSIPSSVIETDLRLAKRCRGETTNASRKSVSIRSEEHTSELQSHLNLVYRLLLEKKNHDLSFSCTGTRTAVAVLMGSRMSLTMTLITRGDCMLKSLISGTVALFQTRMEQ